MADLFGSLLPTGYAAPDVQGTLGGNLFHAYCFPSGPTPTEYCAPSGSNPYAVCVGLGSSPRIEPP